MADRMDTTARHPRRSRHRRGGFSFAEILFAVAILAIGFILVAAIFPVAIQQTQATAEDAAGAAAAREAATAIANLPDTAPNPLYASTAAANTAASLPTLPLFPPTVKNYVAPSTVPPVQYSVPPPAIVVPFTGPRGDVARANLINVGDPRYAYVPFYRRENGSQIAQLIVVAVTARNRPTYDAAVDGATPTNYQGPLNNVVAVHAAAVVDATQYTLCPDLITPAASPAWLCEGCALLTNRGTNRSYRLGRALATATTPATQYEMDPGDNLSVGPGDDGVWGSYGGGANTAPNDIVDAAANYSTNSLMPTGTLQPVGAYAVVYPATGSIGGRITLARNLQHAVGALTPSISAPTLVNDPPPMATTGAFVIVADDYPYDPTQPSQANVKLPLNAATITVGALNGRIYRLGQPVPQDTAAGSTNPVPPGTFELDPQYATVPTGSTLPVIPIGHPVGTGLVAGGTTLLNGPWARVYLVGMGRSAPLSPTDSTAVNTLTTYSGPAQDAGVYSTFFAVR